MSQVKERGEIEREIRLAYEKKLDKSIFFSLSLCFYQLLMILCIYIYNFTNVNLILSHVYITPQVAERFCPRNR